MRTLPVLCFAVATSVVAAPSASDACSAPACWPGVITPRDVTPVPANLPGIYWRPLSGDGGMDPANVVLATAAAPATPLPFTTMTLADGAFLLVPSQPLVEGTTYVVEDSNTCNGFGTGPSASFVAGAAAPLPSYLGSIAVTSDAVEQIDVATSSGSCSTEVTAHRVMITPSLTAEATPWTTVFHFELLVDGQVWQRTDSINVPPSVQGTWQLYRTCLASGSGDPGASLGLGQGAHIVSVRATIPGTSTVLMSDEITVDMHCPGEPGGEPGDGDGGGCQASTPASGSCLVLVVLGVVGTVRRRRWRRSRASRASC